MTKVLVIGATGQQGGATARALLAKDASGHPQHTVHALVRDPSSPAARALAAQGAVLFEGDLDSPAALAAAAAGTEALFFASILSIADTTAEPRWTGNILAAARAAGTVRRVVYSSVRTVRYAKQVAGWDRNPFFVSYIANKLGAEAAVRGSGEDAPVPWAWTVLRPCEFPSNYHGPMAGFQTGGMPATGVWPCALPADFGVAVIDYEDIGRAAAAALTSGAAVWDNRDLDVVGDVTTPPEMIRALSAAAGRPLRYELLGREQAEAAAVQDPIAQGQLLRVAGESGDTDVPRVQAEWVGEGFRFTTFAEYVQAHREQIAETYKGVPDI